MGKRKLNAERFGRRVDIEFLRRYFDRFSDRDPMLSMTVANRIGEGLGVLLDSVTGSIRKKALADLERVDQLSGRAGRDALERHLVRDGKRDGRSNEAIALLAFMDAREAFDVAYCDLLARGMERRLIQRGEPFDPPSETALAGANDGIRAHLLGVYAAIDDECRLKVRAFENDGELSFLLLKERPVTVFDVFDDQEQVTSTRLRPVGADLIVVRPADGLVEVKARKKARREALVAAVGAVLCGGVAHFATRLEVDLDRIWAVRDTLEEALADEPALESIQLKAISVDYQMRRGSARVELRFDDIYQLADDLDVDPSRATVRALTFRVGWREGSRSYRRQIDVGQDGRVGQPQQGSWPRDAMMRLLHRCGLIKIRRR